MLEDSKRTTAERKELDLQGARMAELAIEEKFFENKGRISTSSKATEMLERWQAA